MHKPEPERGFEYKQLVYNMNFDHCKSLVLLSNYLN